MTLASAISAAINPRQAAAEAEIERNRAAAMRRLRAQHCNRKVYVIGSLRNPAIPQIARYLREALNCEVFDDWYAAGPEADDYWQAYEKERGRTYAESMQGYAAPHVANFDKKHLDECTDAVLVLPAGKSGHLELGYCIGSGKRGFILLEEDVERWDVMYHFATAICPTVEDLVIKMKEH